MVIAILLACGLHRKVKVSRQSGGGKRSHGTIRLSPPFPHMLPAALLLTSTLSIDTPIDCDVTANPLVLPPSAPPPLNLEGDNNSVWLRDACRDDVAGHPTV